MPVLLRVQGQKKLLCWIATTKRDNHLAQHRALLVSIFVVAFFVHSSTKRLQDPACDSSHHLLPRLCEDILLPSLSCRVTWHHKHRFLPEVVHQARWLFLQYVPVNSPSRSRTAWRPSHAFHLAILPHLRWPLRRVHITSLLWALVVRSLL